MMTEKEEKYFSHLGRLHNAIWPQMVERQACYPHGQVSLPQYLKAWAKERGEASVIIFYGRRVTFSELDALSDRCAALLHSRGVKSGDRVAVILGNCPQFLIAFYAILKLGAVYVPVNPLFKEAELVHELLDASARVVICVDTFAPLLMQVRQRVGVETVFTTSLGEFLPKEPEIVLPAGLDAPYQSVVGTEPLMPAVLACTASVPETTAQLDAVAALNYTGGTTGLPKGCIHTQRDMIYTAASSNTTNGVISSAQCGAAIDDVTLNFLPMFWIAGENAGLINPVFTGAPMVLLARWDPLAAMQAIERYRVRRTFLVVDNAVEIMEHPSASKFNLRSLTSARVASFVRKNCIEYRRRWFDLTGTILAEGAWGMTETHTSDTFTTGMQDADADLLGRPGFVGLPVPGTLIKICDFSSGELMEQGQDGEIVVKTPSLFKGYWMREQASREAIRDGWFHTGDIGCWDERGFLHYLGRRKEMLKVRGMSVFPTEVEALIGQHPQVLGSAVVGREDADRGQVPVAFVRLRPGAALSPEELQTWCRSQMATYKVPEIRLVQEWPMTSTGKIKKHELQALADHPAVE